MSNCFIVCSLFFPRLTLLICWLFVGLPHNTTPFIVDALMAFFLPRVLIAWWAHELGLHPLISVLFVVSEVFEKLSARGSRRSPKNQK